LTTTGWCPCGDNVAFEAARVVEVELFQRLAGREWSVADAALNTWSTPSED